MNCATARPEVESVDDLRCYNCGVAFKAISPTARFIETATRRPICLGCNVKPMTEDQCNPAFRRWLNTHGEKP